MQTKISHLRRVALGALVAVGVMVPAGMAAAAGSSGTLAVHTGRYYADTPGAVVQNLEIRGDLVIKANNVTIRNVKVVGSLTAATDNALIQVDRGTSGVRIEDTTVRPVYVSEFTQGIRGWGFTADRVDISNVTDGVMITGANTTVRNSTIHDLYIGPSTVHSDGTTHSDSIQIEGGTNIVLEGNSLAGANVAAVMVTQNAGTVRTLDIRNNQLRDGTCTINMDEKGKGAFTGVTISSNVFGPTTNNSGCAMRLPRTSPITTSGNTLIGGGSPYIWWY